MSYEKQPTINKNGGSLLDNETIDAWIIRTNGQEWKLSATRYQREDGTKSHPYWHLTKLTRGNISVTLLGRFEDAKPKVGVNWPAQGDRTIEETREFSRDLAAALEAAQIAQSIIDSEEA